MNWKTPPTDDEIRTYVYANTFQETSPAIEEFIKGMIHMKDKWVEYLREKKNE